MQGGAAMKTRLLKSLAWLVTIVASSHAYAQTELSGVELYEIFPRADYSRPAKIISEMPAWEAWRAARDEDSAELVGYVFLTKLAGTAAHQSLLIGLTPAQTIAGIKIRGGSSLHEEFVAQFVGKSVTTTFQIAREPADLLFLPAKIKAEAGRLELAESIVKEIEDLAKLLVVSDKLNLTFMGTPKVLHQNFSAFCKKQIHAE